ncbi:MAG: hypothetical protein JWO31_2380, partial [Phycisphaerales bacterium]|nr:hypothetical protein [Phycisphaerales bacterium]
ATDGGWAAAPLDRSPLVADDFRRTVAAMLDRAIADEGPTGDRAAAIALRSAPDEAARAVVMDVMNRPAAAAPAAVRRRFVALAARYGPVATVTPAMRTRASDPDPDVALAAIDFLTKRASDFEPLYAGLASPDGQVRAGCVALAGRLGSTPRPDWPRLTDQLRRIASADPDPALRPEAFGALTTLGPKGQAALAELARSGPPEVRDRATARLSTVGNGLPAAVAIHTERLQAGDTATRAAAMAALAKANPSGWPVALLVAVATADPDPGVRRQSAALLVDRGTDRRLGRVAQARLLAAAGRPVPRHLESFDHWSDAGAAGAFPPYVPPPSPSPGASAADDAVVDPLASPSWWGGWAALAGAAGLLGAGLAIRRARRLAATLSPSPPLA